jgi:hypothetical protein
MIKNEIEIDITDEMATYTVSKMISLLKVLDRNGFSSIHFDGYNGSICVYKSYQPERLNEKTPKGDAIV